ncbi:ABC transporter ATP-binding protein [Alcaligenaceae bacterium]|nr:ABC transporter ATP-binding protein [Alcaligenaceae bacterium]
MNPLLQVQGLVKRYGNLLVTDQVDLDIFMGEIHAVIGPNGAGKTTLINQIAGELPADQGQIRFDGVNVTRWSVARRARSGMGRSYQINSIIPEFTVLENILLAVQAAAGHNWYFWRPVIHIPKLVDQAEITLELLQLQGVRDRVSGALSYGQQRQVELAMALAMQPRLLLLDEPMAGLGPSESEHMTGILQDLRQHYGILLIEHDMQAVFALAQRVSVLVHGAVAFTGTPQQVRESDLVRAAYLGDEEILHD